MIPPSILSKDNLSKIERLLALEQSIFLLVNATGELFSPEQFEMIKRHWAARLLVP